MAVMETIADALKASKIKFSVSGADYRIAVESFNADEKISAPFDVSLSLISEDQIKAADVIEKQGLLTVVGQTGDRYFHGVISQFMLSGKNGRFYLYQAKMVPSIWFSMLNQDCRIFQEKSVIEIVKEILKDNNIPTDRYEFRLTESYEPRRHCVQYRETDLIFISRLLEEEGLFYFFEHYRDKHVLVFADSTIAYKPIEGNPRVTCNAGGGLVAQEESVSEFALTRSVRPGKIVQTAYNFKKPSLDLTVQRQGKTHDKYEIYDYPCNYGHTERGRRLARIRLEEQKTFEEMAEGSSNSPRLIPGFTFELDGHDFSELDRKYVCVMVRHNGSQFHVLGEKSGIGGDFSYQNHLTAIPATVPLRPGRAIDKPVIQGLQTATVVGPEGEEIYTDDWGRVKVQFHWDRLGKRDEKSSCWLRTAQAWGGGGWGAQFIPRVGDEVLVAFMEGDPDWPIIVGCLYNQDNQPLYDLRHHKTQSGIRTRSYPKGEGFNELRFEDKLGEEHIYLQGERDWNILIKNDKGQSVGHDETLAVGNNRIKTVGASQSETIGVNKEIRVGANHSETIGQNMSLNVGSNQSVTVGGAKTETVTLASAETVGGAKALTVGGALAVTVAGAMNTAVGLGQAEEVGLIKKTMVGKSYDIAAGDSIRITCGKSSIRLDKDGTIEISGTGVSVNGSSRVAVAGQDVEIAASHHVQISGDTDIN
ncbi:MAG: type VI secretion system tip protein VgrG [Syntrophaceae bacterium]|nr:type VI secretion system tip protein VgrG [Syntrophaceae bacterium]